MRVKYSLILYSQVHGRGWGEKLNTANGMDVLHTDRGPAASVGQALSIGSRWVDVPGEPAKGRVGSLVGGSIGVAGICFLVSLRLLFLRFVLLSSPFPKMFLLLPQLSIQDAFVADVGSRCMDEEEENKRFRYLSNLSPVKNC